VRAAALDAKAAAPEFWNDAERAQALLKERADAASIVDTWRRQSSALDDARVFLELAEEGDEEASRELTAKVRELEEGIAAGELKRILGGEHDAGNAILTLHPGAGGTEAQDWAEMLLRMYLRWCERRRYRTQVVDLQPGEGAGIKSATVTVEGSYAYATSRPRRASTGWSESLPSTRTRGGTPPSLRCSCTPRSMTTSRSRSGTRIFASIPIDPVEPADSM